MNANQRLKSLKLASIFVASIGACSIGLNGCAPSKLTVGEESAHAASHRDQEDALVPLVGRRVAVEGEAFNGKAGPTLKAAKIEGRSVEWPVVVTIGSPGAARRTWAPGENEHRVRFEGVLRYVHRYEPEESIAAVQRFGADGIILVWTEADKIVVVGSR